MKRVQIKTQLLNYKNRNFEIITPHNFIKNFNVGSLKCCFENFDVKTYLVDGTGIIMNVITRKIEIKSHF